MNNENKCITCYWKKINEGKEGFCYMFEKQMNNCAQYKELNND